MRMLGLGLVVKGSLRVLALIDLVWSFRFLTDYDYVLGKMNRCDTFNNPG